ncbi:MAG: DNA polymerase III subunit beta [Desulfurivibrionaceae bacterium]
MSFVINISRDDLLNTLSSIQNITNKPATVAVLNNFLLKTDNDSVEITATDLEVAIRKKIPAEILSPGNITLPSRKLFEIVRESNAETIHLEMGDNKWVKINAGSGNYSLAGLESDNFPSIPEYDEESLINFAGKDIKNLIDKTIFSVAADTESNFTLHGILVEKDVKDNENLLRMVSSDGHRLSLIEKRTQTDLSPFDLNQKTFIPKSGAQEIKKFCDNKENVHVGLNDKQAVLKSNNSLLIIRLMHGDFPNFNNLIDKVNRASYFEIDRKLLLSSIRRMNLFNEDNYNVVKWTLTKDNLTLSSQSTDIGSAQEEIPVEFTGEDMELGFNGRFFIEGLQAISSEKVSIIINGQSYPCLIHSKDEPDFICLIMPMEL